MRIIEKIDTLFFIFCLCIISYTFGQTLQRINESSGDRNLSESAFFFHLKPEDKDVHQMIQAIPCKNLLRNASFEVSALDGWWSLAGRTNKDAYAGKWCLAVSFTKKQPELRSEFRRIDPGKEYTFSVYLKSDKQVDVNLGIRSGLRKSKKKLLFPGPQKIVTVNKSWERYSVSGIVPKTIPNACFISIRPVSGSEPVMLYVDAAKLEIGGKPTKYSPASPVTIGARIENATDYAYFPGQTVPVAIEIHSLEYAGETLPLAFKIEDLFGRTVKQWTRKVSLNANGYASILEEVNSDCMGSIRLWISTNFKNAENSRYQICWAIIPPHRNDINPDNSPFGMHIALAADAVKLEQKMGVRWDRLLDMGWHHYVRWDLVEPQKGKFVFKDDLHNRFRHADVQLMGTLFATPDWARRPVAKGESSSQATPPANFDDYADYVKKVVRRYGDYIKYWEIWNEPYGPGFWTGTPQEYVELLKIGYATIKKVNPNARVIGGCIHMSGPNRKWAEKIFKAGAMKYMDVLSYHAYHEPQHEANDAGRKEILDMIQMKNKYGGKNLPIWNTEGGENCSDFNTQIIAGLEGDNVVSPSPNYIAAAASLVRKYVYTLGAGVKKWMYYFSVSRDYFTNYNMFSIRGLHGVLKPTGTAYAVLANKIDGMDFKWHTRVSGVADIYVFDNGEKCIAVVWGSGLGCDEKNVTWKIYPKDLKIDRFDIAGNICPSSSTKLLELPLSAIPFYLEMDNKQYDKFRECVKTSSVQDLLPAGVRDIQIDLGAFCRNVFDSIYGYSLCKTVNISNAAIIGLYQNKTLQDNWKLMVIGSAINKKTGFPQLNIPIDGLCNIKNAGYDGKNLTVGLMPKPEIVEFTLPKNAKDLLVANLSKSRLLNWVPRIPVRDSEQARENKVKPEYDKRSGYWIVGLSEGDKLTYTVPANVNDTYYIYAIVRSGGQDSDDYSGCYQITVNGAVQSVNLVGPKILIYDDGPGSWKIFMGTLRTDRPVKLCSGDKIMISTSKDWATVGDVCLRVAKQQK